MVPISQAPPTSPDPHQSSHVASLQTCTCLSFPLVETSFAFFICRESWKEKRTGSFIKSSDFSPGGGDPRRYKPLDAAGPGPSPFPLLCPRHRGHAKCGEHRRCTPHQRHTSVPCEFLVRVSRQSSSQASQESFLCVCPASFKNPNRTSYKST